RLRAPVGIDDLTLGIQGHGVDGQVAALQVLLQGDRGIGVEGEAAVAVTTLALGSGQRVLLAGVRVQEHREVLPDRAEASLQQQIRRGDDHYPVALMPGHAQQLVTDGAADQIGIEVCFHGAKLRVRWGAAARGHVTPNCRDGTRHSMEEATCWERRAPRAAIGLDEGVLAAPVDELVLVLPRGGQIGGMFMSKRGMLSSVSLGRGGMCCSSLSASPSQLCRWTSKPHSRCRCLSMRSVVLPSGLPSWRW